MMKKIIFLCVRYNIRIFAKLFHTFTIIKDIIWSKFNLSRRSPVLFNWAKTYISYIQSEEWMQVLLNNLSPKDKLFMENTIKKIEYIAYNNYVDYNILYSQEDEKEQQRYLKYFYAQPKNNYFKEHNLWLVNEYCIKRDMNNFWFSIDWWDIIDCGAYIWDSWIAFSDFYPNAHIYALEPDKNNYKELCNVITLHNKDTKITALNVWVWEKDMTAYLSDEWIGSKISTSWTPISIRSLDSLIEEYNLKPSLIKWDIEWYEYYSILWAINSIKKFKPILFISVYHHGRDLFEVKKLLEELNVWYKFTFTRRDSMTAFSDTLLVCYV